MYGHWSLTTGLNEFGEKKKKKLHLLPMHARVNLLSWLGIVVVVLRVESRIALRREERLLLNGVK